MSVRAITRDGSEFALAEKYTTVEQLIASLTQEGLTGSALPEAELETATGETIRYEDVNMLVEVTSL